MPSLLDFFGALSRGARAALPYITGAVAAGRSPADIVAGAREAGFSFRTQSAYDIIAALQGRVDSQRAIRLTPVNDIIRPELHGVAITNLLRNYSYSVLVRMHHSETGEALNQNVTVSSNEPLSQTQILATAETYASSSNYGTNQIIDEMNVEDARRSPALGDIL